MRAVIQRVTQATVTVDDETVGRIGPGLLVYLGVGRDDDENDAQYLAEKIINLRIFPDDRDRMNLSLKDTGGAVLLVSQFTLYGDCRKGRRPGFDQSADPDKATHLYEHVAHHIAACNVPVQTGVFAAHMHVQSLNDGPVTFLLDSTRMF